MHLQVECVTAFAWSMFKLVMVELLFHIYHLYLTGPTLWCYAGPDGVMLVSEANKCFSHTLDGLQAASGSASNLKQTSGITIRGLRLGALYLRTILWGPVSLVARHWTAN